MANPFDIRNNQRAQEILKQLPGLRHQPFVGAADLEEIEKVFRALPPLDFPINSIGEFIDKLGGPDQMLRMADTEVNPLRMIKYMPAYYFPIASMENLIEKMAEMIRQNRKQVDIPRALEDLRRQLVGINYPIGDAATLIKLVGGRGHYRFMGADINPEELLKRVPSGFFPVQSQDDLERKVIWLLRKRPLIVKD